MQLALRDIVGSLSIEDFLEQRNRIGPGLLERSVPAAAEIGVEITNADVKDIMFPGDLKKMFAQVAAARQEGMAALERARGESAALRSLANTASLFDDHPNLMQMRLLQQIGDSDSNTFVIGAQSRWLPASPIEDRQDLPSMGWFSFQSLTGSAESRGRLDRKIPCKG